MAAPTLDLTGRVAIVTGSGKGIGRALALGLAGAGAKVAVVARTQAAIDAVAGEIRASGGSAVPVCADVTDAAQVDELVLRTLDEWGQIDILVNNVGGGGFRLLLDTDEATWDALIDLNLKSVYLCSRAVGKVMVEQQNGNIINISTGQATWPTAGNGAHYGAAKAGLEVLTRTLAQEWGPYNIRVNTVVPGVVETPLLRKVYDERPEELEKTVARIPLGRIAQPEDLVGPVLFLASDASAYVSGTAILVRGGRFG